MAHILIVSGSHRKNGNSHKVAEHVLQVISKENQGVKADILDISSVPFWDEGKWGDAELADKWKVWSPISEKLRQCDGIVIITPEYAGMATPKITNFLMISSSDEVGHKPALLVTVSASRGGAYPISQLRSFSAKNNHICWVPDHVIIRDVEQYLKDSEQGKESYTRKMLGYATKIFLDYSHALKSIREKGNINFKDFPYGM
jgi:azobenzene reductase